MQSPALEVARLLGSWASRGTGSGRHGLDCRDVRSYLVPSLPVFITNFEILRSQDYVMITFSTPTGEVVDGRMQTLELQRITLSHSRFLEFAAGVVL